MSKKRKRIQPEDIVVVEEDKRIHIKDRDPKLYYYEMRHSDSDWTQPIRIEPFVLVNFLGTLVTKTPLPGVGVLFPTWKEKRVICEKMQQSGYVSTLEKRGRKSLIRSDIYGNRE